MENTEIEICYNTALMQVAERMQATYFCRRRLSIQVYEGSSVLRMNDFLTPRVRATTALYSTLVAALSKEIAPTILEPRIRRVPFGRVFKVSKIELDAFIQGGINTLIYHHKVLFAFSLEDIGVKRHLAYKIAHIIIFAREEMLAFINSVDDTGDQYLEHEPGP